MDEARIARSGIARGVEFFRNGYRYYVRPSPYNFLADCHDSPKRLPEARILELRYHQGNAAKAMRLGGGAVRERGGR